MDKKAYKKECKKMSFHDLTFEKLGLIEAIGNLNDLKEKAQQDNDISSLCNIMNKRAECYEKLEIVKDELQRKIKEEQQIKL